MRELSNILNESTPINLDSLNTSAKLSTSNTSKLNVSRDIRDSTRAKRIPIACENTKRLSTFVERKVLKAGTSTPQDRVSSKVRRVSMSDSLTSTKVNPKLKSSLTISEASAESVVAAADIVVSDVGNNVAGVSDDVAGVDGISGNINVDVVVADTYKNNICNNVAGDDAKVIATGDIVELTSVHVVNENVDVDCSASEVALPAARNRKHKQLIGGNTDAEMFAALPSVPRHRFLHISRLNKSVTEENVINYIARKLDLPTTSLVCHKLIKKEADISSLHYVNFKLGIPTALFNNALQSSIWPVGVQIKKFEYRSKNALNSNEQVLT